MSQTANAFSSAYCGKRRCNLVTYDLGDGAELRLLEARHIEEFLAFDAANRAYHGEFATTLAMIIRS
jgi:hypothetical protein